jgi:hypothetical protein
MRNKFAAFAAVLALSCPALATLTSTSNTVSYTGNAATKTFTVPFKFLANADLVVSVGGVGKALTTDYTVKGAGNATGSITFTTAPASGASVVITRSVPLTQTTSFAQNRSLDPKTISDALDKAMMAQQDARAAQALKDASQDAALAVGAVGGTSTLITPTGGAAALSIGTMFGDLRNVRGFGAIGDGVADDRAAFATANASTGTRWVPTGTYRIASSITLGGVWRFSQGTTLRPTSGNTVTFDTTALVYGSAPFVDTSAGGLVTYQAGSSKVTTQIGPAAKTANIVNGYAGNQVASDVGLSVIGGGGNAGTENYIGYLEALDRRTGDGVTTTFTTTFDATPAQIQLVLVRSDGVRVTTVVSNATLTQSGTKVQVVYPQAGHFVNDGAGGAEGTNAALTTTEKLYMTSTIKTPIVGSGSDYSAIYGGYDNVTTGLRNTVEGAHHRLTAGTHNTIFGGSYDRISGSGDYNAIFGGSGNEVSAGGSGSFATGFGNTVAGTGPGTAIGSTNSTNGAFATAIGSSNQANANGATVLGRLNVVSGADAFVGGNANTVSAPFSTVGGFTNSVTNATGYTSVFGRQNTSSGAYGIVSGQSNTATADWTRVSGKNANATLPFCSVIGGEQIAALGDTQSSVCVVRRQTTTATATELRFGAASPSRAIRRGPSTC